MKKTGLWLLLIGSALILPSCVYDREMSYFNEQIASLNRKVSNLEEAAGGETLETIQSNQAQMRLEVDQLKTEIAKLSGRTEDNEHVVKRIVEEDLSKQDAMQARLDEVSKKLEVMDRMVRQQQEYLGLEPPPPPEGELPPEASLPEDRVVPARETEPSRTAQGPATPEEALPSGEIEMYEHALSLYRKGEYEAAMRGFQAFLTQHPKSDRADNAYFWIGESHMALKEYEQAILAYQKVIKNYPKGNKVANAMLRQAVAFLEIKDKTSARLLLKKIIKEYPGSSEATLAEKKLGTL
ncbi:MAG: tol-pal system protein YbgF [Desulfobacteraceae bacterium]|jgi:tol-pal system protein YbgF